MLVLEDGLEMLDLSLGSIEGIGKFTVSKTKVVQFSGHLGDSFMKLSVLIMKTLNNLFKILHLRLESIESSLHLSTIRLGLMKLSSQGVDSFSQSGIL